MHVINDNIELSLASVFNFYFKKFQGAFKT